MPDDEIIIKAAIALAETWQKRTKAGKLRHGKQAPVNRRQISEVRRSD